PEPDHRAGVSLVPGDAEKRQDDPGPDRQRDGRRHRAADDRVGRDSPGAQPDRGAGALERVADARGAGKDDVASGTAEPAGVPRAAAVSTFRETRPESWAPVARHGYYSPKNGARL